MATRTVLNTKISRAQTRIRKLRDEVRALRKNLPAELVTDYTLTGANGKPVKLSKLFGKFDELVLIHNMGPGCPYCTLWADGLDGYSAYFRDRCALVLETDAPMAKLSVFVKKRGWAFPVVSSLGTSLKFDFGVKNEKGNIPAISSFYKKGGKIYRHAAENLGPGDDFCSFWSVMDLLKDSGRDVKVSYQLR
jgi:predicted dithiol-disulfide oxidoreductase (DUF899 family)